MINRNIKKCLRLIFRMVIYCTFSFSVFSSRHAFAKTDGGQPGSNSNVSSSVSLDLDQEVKDNKLRADSGKKSNVSSSLLFNYSGGAIKEPFESTQPNVTGDKRPYPVSMSGYVGARYRWNKNQSFYGAIGFSQSTPFHNDSGPDPKIEFATPMLNINTTRGEWPAQWSTSHRLFIATEDFNRDVYEVATYGYGINALFNIRNSNFDVGIGTSFFYKFFSSSTGYYKSQFGGAAYETPISEVQNDYGWSLTPSLQWSKDRLSVFTSVSLRNWLHYRADPQFDFYEGKPTQTIGAGFAVTRDVYVSPNVMFNPADVDPELTVASVSASINF